MPESAIGKSLAVFAARDDSELRAEGAVLIGQATEQIEIAKQGDGKGSAIDRATASDDERSCPLPKFFREIVCRLVHVHTNAEDGESYFEGLAEVLAVSALEHLGSKA